MVRFPAPATAALEVRAAEPQASGERAGATLAATAVAGGRDPEAPKPAPAVPAKEGRQEPPLAGVGRSALAESREWLARSATLARRVLQVLLAGPASPVALARQARQVQPVRQVQLVRRVLLARPARVAAISC